nr:NAD(P)/FAD-dependent oxidoreductase [Deltaproteobacteria bacterium]
MKAEVVVIGSGISGLTAAALLAKKGKRVVILEQNRRPGGALKRFTRRGIPFDIGFHYSGGMGKGEILRALWKYIGVWPRLAVLPFPEEGNENLRIMDSGKVVRAFFSYDRLEDELQRVFPGEKQGIYAYLNKIREISNTIPFFNLDLPLTPYLHDLFSPKGMSLAQLLMSLIRDTDLHAVLSTPVFLYGVPPREVNLTIHASVAHPLYSGVYAIDGGGQAIVDAFLATLAEAGVDILTGQKVESVLIRGNQVAGVKTSEKEIYASHVIYTGHPTSLLDLVPGEIFRKAFCNRMRNLINTDSMFIVFGAIDDPDTLGDLTWINYYNIRTGLDIMDLDLRHPEKSIMINAPGRRDSDSTGASGGVLLIRMSVWDEVARFDQGVREKRSAAYRKWKAESADKMIEQAGRLWGDAYSRIEPLAIGTPLTFRDKLGLPMGATYGVRHSMNQFSPGVRTRLPGLWLSGQGTLMAGIMGASLAGMVTVGEIEGLEPLWYEVRQCR